jgi:hypothetical protein
MGAGTYVRVLKYVSGIRHCNTHTRSVHSTLVRNDHVAVCGVLLGACSRLPLTPPPCSMPHITLFYAAHNLSLPLTARARACV